MSAENITTSFERERLARKVQLISAMGGFEISHERALEAVDSVDSNPSNRQLRVKSMNIPKVSFTRFM